VVAAGAVAGRQVTTLAGLGTRQEPHRLQAAFIDAQATQCGYCLNGWIMTAAALLDRKPQPTLTEIAEALAGLKCRCGAHMSIMRAIVRAAGASET
jgi:nicotinate dehydrogenase subunit A